jgi:hypothetical protein
VIRLPAIVLVAALAFVAAGCGGSSKKEQEQEGTPPRQWVRSVCTALDEWQASLQQQAKGLPSAVLQADSPADAKRRIDDFLDEVIAETDTMIGRVQRAGRPAATEGRRFAAQVQARLRKVRAAFADARRRVEQVPTDDPFAFQRQLTEIGQDLLSQARSLGTLLAQAPAGAILNAIGDVSRCRTFTTD